MMHNIFHKYMEPLSDWDKYCAKYKIREVKNGECLMSEQNRQKARNKRKKKKK